MPKPKDETIRVSKRAHRWLTSRKAASGQPIKFIVDILLDAYIKPPKESK